MQVLLLQAELLQGPARIAWIFTTWSSSSACHSSSSPSHQAVVRNIRWQHRNNVAYTHPFVLFTFQQSAMVSSPLPSHSSQHH